MDPRPSPIPPGTLSVAASGATLLEIMRDRLEGWQLVAALGIVAVVAIARGFIEALKVRARVTP